MTRVTALPDKHAFVTGASRGIGAAIAAALENAGARVTRVARHAGSNVLACDVSSAQAVAAAMAQAQQRSGPIHILINNAGIAASARFLETGEAILQEMFDTNLKGAWHCSQRALPAMLDAGWGRIVNVASLAGLDGFPYISAYCTSKHALVGMTRALAAEFSGSGIAISAVCPGYTDTGLLSASIANITARTKLSPAQARAQLAALNPAGRILAPAEIAAHVVSLCLTDAGQSNGRILSIP